MKATSRKLEDAGCRIVPLEVVVLDRQKLSECKDPCPFGALEVVRSDSGDVEVKVDVSKCTVCIVCMALCGPDTVRVVADWRCERS
ncbi:MAG: hypothetical protein ABWW70_04125 [Thermoproteota archaeon]